MPRESQPLLDEPTADLSADIADELGAAGAPESRSNPRVAEVRAAVRSGTVAFEHVVWARNELGEPGISTKQEAARRAWATAYATGIRLLAERATDPAVKA